MSFLYHVLEYSKSSRAKCVSLRPCGGTPIIQDTLRYGMAILGRYGEQIMWRHWGCVTPDILQELAIENLDRIRGFQSLRIADQAKIRRAIARKRVDDSDVPKTENPPTLPQPVPSATISASTENAGGKRKASAISDPYSSQTQASSSSSQAPAMHRSSGLAPIEVIEVNSDDEEEPQNEARDELYCIMKTQVVGVQYYRGMAGLGEEVILEREPTNPYDSLAIKVTNIQGIQVGHIPRTVVDKLTPLVDQNLVSIEGVIEEGNLGARKKVYSMAMTLRIYGASDKRDQLEPLLAWATPNGRGFPPARADGSRDIPGSTNAPRTHSYAPPPGSQQLIASGSKLTPEQADVLQKAAELNSILTSLEKVDDESRRSSLLDKLCSVEDVLKLPLHQNPPGLANGDLVVDLLKHQSQALQWCIDREYPKLPTKESDKPEQFWQVRKNGNKKYYYNLATKTPQEAIPILGRGALCADSMGLGKTLTMLALILATKGDKSTEFSRATLIVVPLSLISNWEGQIKEHCVPNAIKYHVYYGAGRSVSPERLRKYDVVITTYQVVAGEHAGSTKKGGGQGQSKKQKTGAGLFGVQWKRVILDEGHTIRNPRTKMSKAVCALEAQRRWVVTGTPIINTPRDLGSILSFLQICKPLDSEDLFKRLLLRPLKDGISEGYQLLRALMNQTCIRRTKEMHDSDGQPLVPLPGVEMITIPVKLDPKTRELYDTIENLSQQKFQTLMDTRGSVAVPTNVLSMLTRLRQIVLHPGLIPSNYVQQMQESINEDSHNKPGKLIKVTPELKLRLQAMLAQLIEDSEECPICFEVLDDPRITGCAHAYCLACISEILTRDSRCPMDRREITIADLVEPAPPSELTQAFLKDEPNDDEENELRTGSSAKIDRLVQLLQLTPGNEKSLVFSQFTSFLDKIEEALREADISYVRFDGKMSVKRRQETLERFCVPLKGDEGRSTKSKTPLSSRRKKGKVVVKVDSDFSSDTEDSDCIDDTGNSSSDAGILDDDWAKKAVGKVKGKAKKTMHSSFGYDSGTNPRVMLISLKAGSLGLNLTVANNVYLMDPWWQEGIESQAIDRCNRIGQKKKVHVYQLIAENTVESKVIDIQDKKKKLINEAFSGIKNASTIRQKKEARMQELIELFGMRQQAATQQ